MPICTPQEITDNYIKGSKAKASSPAWRLFILAFLAGALIALGAVASSTAAQGIADTGTARLLMGAIFPIGLIMVVLLGTELFTGNALLVTAAIAKEITWGQLLRNWGIVYIGNFCGAVLIAFLMAYFGQLDIGGGSLAIFTVKIAASKCSLPWQNAFVLGIFCNLLVCIAVYLGNTAHDTAGKILGIFFPVFGFVVAGFEHCVANMYYIPAGIFAYANPAYTELVTGAAASVGINLAALDISTFIFANLIPVTLGNIVGGAVVGVMMYAAHATKKRKTEE